jgi:RNA polymerase sigma-70 factor, ECF subfamily
LNGQGGQLEGDVLSRARAGDERAFLALYRAANPGLLRYLTVLAGDQAMTVADQTWHEVSADLVGFEGDLEQFRGWVATVARRRALDLVAARGRHDGSVRESSPEGVADLHPPQTRRALELIAQLPLRQSEVLLLRTVVGLDEAATATVLGLRRCRVRSAARRAFASLGVRLALAVPGRRPARPAEPVTVTLPNARRPVSGELTPPRGLAVPS